LDYDFDWYVFEFEYCQNPDSDKLPNENDKIYLEYCELLMQAKEAGLGYRVEWEDTLYLAPTPLVTINSRNQFHNDSAPAIRWKGGREFYFFNGVAVNEQIIMRPETLTKEDVINEKNEEVRRVMVEKIGAERFAKMMDFKVVNEDDFGALITTEINGDVYMFAHVLCPSTQREYYLQVPATLEDALKALEGGTGQTWEEWKPENEKSIWSKSGNMETCKQAVAWTFGKSEQDYNPVIQT
jgi:hypothetical protein